ncbi:hypothetical protein ACQP2F_29105 [Actinoplanes sp. CA-030573]|uniref:hypothetical protein n=1 Tax=Actinoplanes sp. CA-030573 TaxID=3239898 RepID=UPI003D93DCD6
MSQTAARSLGAGAAVVVLAVLPLAIGSAKSTEPTAQTGSLTVNISGHAGPYVIEVSGPAPPPTRPATLRDTTGEHTAAVVPSSGHCAPDSRRAAFDQQQTPWCLALGEAPAGHELTGSIANGSGAKLTMTVRRRVAFLPGPFAALVLGLVAGLSVAVLPRLLRRLVRWVVLTRMIRRADQDTSAATRIQGLKNWAEIQRKSGLGREALIAAVSRVTTSGPEHAKAARARLSAALAEISSIPDDHPLKAAARAIAGSTVNKIDDFYAGGEARATHPADQWTAAVVRLGQYRKELDSQERRIDALPPSGRQEARRAWDKALVRFGSLKDPDALVTMEPALDQLRDAVDDAVVGGTTRGSAAPPPAYVPAVRGRLEAVTGLRLRGGELTAWIWIARILTAAAVLIALGYAFVTIKSSGYDAKPLFAAGGDYLTLFSAALASGVSATIVALLGNWRPVSSEDEEK